MTQSARAARRQVIRHENTGKIVELYCERFTNLRSSAPVHGAQSYASAVAALEALRDAYADDMLAKVVEVNGIIRDGLSRASTDLAAVLPEQYYPLLYAELGDEWLESMHRPSRLYLVPPEYDMLRNECFVFEDCALHVDWASQVAYELRSPSEVLFFRNRLLNYQAILPEVDCNTYLSQLGAAKRRASDVRALDPSRVQDRARSSG